ncbi:cobalamin 5'-phosphate synthase [Denitrovibrio acetiphilus DSM 12809]|jgi:adenosylcobinamide-GDP ribazoletransferase|uniref:Adenosylcobinamide-GDP ribazoletransferase n=1 Tax=Denitrovibrio acetiphilus (strain DSM 12809 / NBRC 114555 / N2460) TaxID=522772 RepID=D4H1X7_DENA2|nr:adenosylcobinamide-GDP ribazoletransferase [Denitrovibrio acetiphilus]ADD66954.1 cobalamin 5'-phosphate synthase [Denitrovibrio acetiphilus DSM 12809]
MKALRDALSFLTIIKFQSDDFDAVRAMNAFVYVGFLLGGVFVTVALLLGDSFLTPLLILTLWVSLTGALHLDGLMDTADALFSHRDRERKLEIMKDSRSGAMAVVAAILLLLIKFESISQLTSLYIFFIIPALARIGMVWSMKTMPYVRSEGTGKMFFEGSSAGVLFQLVPLVVVLMLLGIKPVLALTAVFVVSVLVLQWWYKRQIGGVTGDLLGAQCEVTEAVMLAFYAGFLQ